MAAGGPKRVMWFTLVQLAVYLVMLTVATRWGLVAVCVAVGIFRWGVLASSYRLLLGHLGVPTRQLVVDAGPAMSGLAALLGLGFAVLEGAGAIGLADAPAAVLAGFAGLVAYAVVLRLCSRSSGTTSSGSRPASRSRPARSPCACRAATASPSRPRPFPDDGPLGPSPRARTPRRWPPPPSSAAASARCCASRRPGAACVVLNYHRDRDAGRLAAGPRPVERDARGLRRPGRLPRAQLRRRRAGGHRARAPAGRQVLITFDDGYRDNYDRAPCRSSAPTARRPRSSSPPASSTAHALAWWDEVAWMVRTSARERICVDGVAVALDSPAAPRPWPPSWTGQDAARQRPRGLPRPPRAGDRHGPRPGRRGRRAVDDVAHGARAARRRDDRRRAHRQPPDPRATSTPTPSARRSCGCRARLHAELGIPMRWFSYPNGDRGSFDARTRALLAEAGVELAFSFDGGFVRRGAAVGPLRRPADRGRPADRRRRLRRDRDPARRCSSARWPGAGDDRPPRRAALGAVAAAAALGGLRRARGDVRARDRDDGPGPEGSGAPSTSTRTRRRPVRRPAPGRPPPRSAATPWCSLDRAVDVSAVGRDRPRAPRLLPAPDDPGRAPHALRDDPLGPERDRDAHRLHRDELELLALPGPALRRARAT